MANMDLTLFSPAGVVLKAAPVKLAQSRLKALGFNVHRDESVLAKFQRFAGTDEARIEVFHRIAKSQVGIALATRGGYGMTRILDRLDWKSLGQSVEAGVQWVGYSDFTAFQLALLKHTGQTTWAGPMAAEDFGGETLDEVTPDCFQEAMSGQLEAVGFKTESGFDGLETAGTLWGGNLTVLCSLLGTQHWPDINAGILFVEDVAEHPYRVERMLLQLHQAGVLERQKALILGNFSAWRASPLDRGYSLKSAVEYLRSVCAIPILTGLPFGHVPTKVCLPIGRSVELFVEKRNALLAW